MTTKTYKATLSRSQGREGWSIIFRHPLRKDPATGKVGRRVRMGLGVRDRQRADQLAQEMNQIIADPSFWDVSARPVAAAKFSSRVVEIFYHDVTPEPIDFFTARDCVIPLPKRTGHKTVLLLGTTGVGKTTLVRQIIGTHPVEERFPSTSTAKTTIADTELLMGTGLFRVVVTFMPRDLVRDYLEEALSEAVSAAGRGESDAEILRCILNHPDQRFRLTYVLGKGKSNTDGDGEEDEEETKKAASAKASNPLTLIDIEKTNRLLDKAVVEVRNISARVKTSLQTDLRALETDARVIAEIMEEEIDNLLRDDEQFQNLADEIMDEIESRFAQLAESGELKKTKQGWPQCWHWENDDRKLFLERVLQFSSNYPGYFGTLLTPLVNGIRVAGPFSPKWGSEKPQMALLDTEGLGHTPESSTSLTTSLTRRFHEVDAIVLVDTAKHPLQAASLTALREIVTSGVSSKLLICFTHMDMMDQDTLPSFCDKTQHIKDSIKNALRAIGEQNGPAAERALRERFDKACFYVGEINQELDPYKSKCTVQQLREMLKAIESTGGKPLAAPPRPTYARTTLVLGIVEAVKNFHEAWRGRLGLALGSNISKAHWTQVRALSRRIAEGWQDHYLDLRPISDLTKELQERIYMFIQSPLSWDGSPPTKDEEQAVFDSFATAVATPLLDMVSHRIKLQPAAEWQKAFDQRGTGSSYRRAAVIKSEIYERAAPVPNVAPLPEGQRNEFLDAVINTVEGAAEQLAVHLK